MNIHISKLDTNKDAPISLLLLADPLEKLVNSYLEKGFCYVLKKKEETIGAAVV